MIEIDGTHGGGQILRSALSLSMITGKPFVIYNIRGQRSRPGLLRQHLTAVNASIEIAQAETKGAEFKSTKLIFQPTKIQSGNYTISIDGAGSTTLVLQTIIPALFYADGGSNITISGGTHNPMAPPFNFLKESWLPQMRAMGANLSLELKRHGFYPKGGGLIEATIEPSQLRSVEWIGNPIERIEAEAMLSGLPLHIAERELSVLAKKIEQRLDHDEILPIPSDQGPGNILTAKVTSGTINNLFVTFGMKGKSAERVAENCATTTNHFLASNALFNDCLADQMLLPIALAGSGSFTTTRISNHLRTNAMVIEQFLPVTIGFSEKDSLIRITIINKLISN